MSVNNVFYFLGSIVFLIWIVDKTWELFKNQQEEKNFLIAPVVEEQKVYRKKTHSDNKEFVYFIYAPEVKRVKIGLTTVGVEERKNKLQTGSPCILYVLAYIATPDSKKLEREIHQQFARYKLHNEFFSFNTEIQEFLEKKSSFLDKKVLTYER